MRGLAVFFPGIGYTTDKPLLYFSRRLAADSSAAAKIRLVLYTPLEETFDCSLGEAIVFTGADDPWVARASSRIPELCRQRGIPCFVIPKANHSLESGDCREDIRALARIMEQPTDSSCTRIPACRPRKVTARSENSLTDAAAQTAKRRPHDPFGSCGLRFLVIG